MASTGYGAMSSFNNSITIPGLGNIYQSYMGGGKKKGSKKNTYEKTAIK